MKKERFTTHGLISGGVGAGKTQILWGLIEQIAVKKNRKAIIYDVKGDWTSAMPNALLLSPWDSRSASWAITDDVNTPQAAEVFAQSLIPSKDGEFWGPAARTILVGVLMKHIHDYQHEGIPWGWRKLADSLAADPYELRDVMANHYPAGLRLLADPTSTTALNVLQTVSAHTRAIEQLAIAWDDGTPRASFSLRAWAKDRYTGPRQIILQAGEKELTARYIGAMINTLMPLIISPALRDAERTRTLAIFLDEFTSIGKLENISQALDKGRSKGCVVWLGFQSIDQIRATYSPDFASGLMSMVGTNIACRMSMGETQNFIAGLFGKRRVAITSHSQSPGSMGPTISQHEETRPVVLPSQLGELGPIKRGKGFAIRAIVSVGSDPLLLEFPGKPIPKLRPGFVAAAWTKGVPKRSLGPKKDPVESMPSRLRNNLPKVEPAMGKVNDRQPDLLDKLVKKRGKEREI